MINITSNCKKRFKTKNKLCTDNIDINVNIPIPTLPTLNAPTIEISSDTLIITDPSSNGDFVSSYDIYKDGTYLSNTSSITVDLSTLISVAGTYAITVKCKGTNFNDSVASNSESYEVSSGYTVTLTAGAYCEYRGTYAYSKDDITYTDFDTTYGSSVTLTGVSTFYIKCTAFTSGTYFQLNESYSEFISFYPVAVNEIKSFTIDANYDLYYNDSTCLASNTLVLTDDGYKEIKDINVGTTLLTYNNETNTNEYNKVIKWWHHPSSNLVTINDELFTMTGDHPIYINDYKVVKGREVKVGDYLINKDGEKILVTNVEFSNESIEVYMIEVENNHNFYITEENILSHNY